MAKYNKIGNTADISPTIQVGQNVYYVSTLIDKHLHAGEDGTEIFTLDGKSKMLKKGEWIGQLYSWDIKQDAKTGASFGRLMFWQNSTHFPQNKVYFVKNKSNNTVNELVLQYNYKDVKTTSSLPSWVLLMPGVYILRDLYDKWKTGNPPKQEGGGLPTQKQTDANDAARDKRDADSKKGPLDGMLPDFKAFFASAKPYLYGAGAVLCAVKAFETPSKTLQVGFGGAAAGLGYLAYTAYSELPTKPKE